MMEIIYDADALRQITNEAILDRRLSITKEEFPKILLKINEINYNQAKEGRSESGIRLCYKDYNIQFCLSCEKRYFLFSFYKRRWRS